jgi:hypothetical protein
MHTAWNPAEDSQAVDRAYRIGQTKNVVVYRFIHCSCVEEKIYEKQVFKEGLRVVSEQGKETEKYFAGQSHLHELLALGPADSVRIFDRIKSVPDTLKIDQFEQNTYGLLGVSRHDRLYAEPAKIQSPEIIADSTVLTTNNDYDSRTKQLTGKAHIRAVIDLTGDDDVIQPNDENSVNSTLQLSSDVLGSPEFEDYKQTKIKNNRLIFADLEEDEEEVMQQQAAEQSSNSSDWLKEEFEDRSHAELETLNQATHSISSIKITEEISRTEYKDEPSLSTSDVFATTAECEVVLESMLQNVKEEVSYADNIEIDHLDEEHDESFFGLTDVAEMKEISRSKKNNLVERMNQTPDIKRKSFFSQYCNPSLFSTPRHPATTNLRFSDSTNELIGGFEKLGISSSGAAEMSQAAPNSSVVDGNQSTKMNRYVPTNLKIRALSACKSQTSTKSAIAKDGEYDFGEYLLQTSLSAADKRRSRGYRDSFLPPCGDDAVAGKESEEEEQEGEEE